MWETLREKRETSDIGKINGQEMAILFILLGGPNISLDGAGHHNRFSDLLRAGPFGARTPVWARDSLFSIPVETGSGVHAGSYTMCAGDPSRG